MVLKLEKHTKLNTEHVSWQSFQLVAICSYSTCRSIKLFFMRSCRDSYWACASDFVSLTLKTTKLFILWRLSGGTRETMALPGSLHELEAKALPVYCLSHLYIAYKHRSKVGVTSQIHEYACLTTSPPLSRILTVVHGIATRCHTQLHMSW